MNDEERRKIWWSEDGSLCLLCGGTGSANVFIDGEPTQMDGPCPNCENNDLRSENYNLQAKLREHPHLFMKGMFADLETTRRLFRGQRIHPRRKRKKGAKK